MNGNSNSTSCRSTAPDLGLRSLLSILPQRRPRLADQPNSRLKELERKRGKRAKKEKETDCHIRQASSGCDAPHHSTDPFIVFFSSGHLSPMTSRHVGLALTCHASMHSPTHSRHALMLCLITCDPSLQVGRYVLENMCGWLQLNVPARQRVGHDQLIC